MPELQDNFTRHLCRETLDQEAVSLQVVSRYDLCFRTTHHVSVSHFVMSISPGVTCRVLRTLTTGLALLERRQNDTQRVECIHRLDICF